MANQDEARQERLLRLAGWLHHRHTVRTRAHDKAMTEVRFARAEFDDIPALHAYSTAAGNAGEKALLRDLEELASFGITVEWEAETQRWLSHAAPLSEAERRALAIAAMSVIIEDATELEEGWHLPGAGLTPGGAEVIVRFGPEIDTAIEAISQRDRLRVTHRHRDGLVEPWDVVFRDGRWFLIGRDVEIGEQRVYAFDAIQQMSRVDTPGVVVIPTVDTETIAVRSTEPDQWIGAQDPVEVILRVDRRFARKARDLLKAERAGTRTSDEWIEMRCTVRNIDTFVEGLFGLRARAVVLAPPDIRAAVKRRLEALI